MSISLLLLFSLIQTGVSEPDNITWVESPNFSNRPAGQDIDSIVIHTTEGSTSAAGTISWFQNPSSNVSAHYIIGYDGDITQMVALNKKSWHATYYNSRSIGIEIAGKSYDPGTWGEKNYEALINLVVWLCSKYDIPALQPSGNAYDYPGNKINVPGIVGHGQLQPWNKVDPGPYFEWEDFIEEVQEKLDNGASLSPPTGLTATSTTGGGIKFKWNPVSNANLYQVTVAENSQDLTAMAASAKVLYVGGNTSYTWNSGITPPTYVWSVTAMNNYKTATTILTPTGTYTLQGEADDTNCSAELASHTTILISSFALLGLVLLLAGLLLHKKSLV
jgi:N-acetyl-anhydromuramyl-L-alanine amidase AmpD